ncbi:MAG TPA: helix-turn-helix domain-containing protein, partial [Chloroflexia bacterium]
MDVSFGNWLKQRRQELGLTQDKLAGQIGCAPVTLQKIERGARHPSRQVALLLAESLGVPAEEREAFTFFARGQLAGTIPEGLAATAIEPKGRSPWRVAGQRQTNLPALLTALIGREREEQALADLLAQPKVRLLTLTGPPGVGKTRLGLQVAAGQVAHFPDGVFLVELAAVAEPDLVVPTIARTLGLVEQPGLPIDASVRAYLRQKRLLLLLDNFEQVLDAAPEVVRLLQAGPALKVLVTSREALHVRGERRFRVPSLALPPRNTMGDLATLALNSAVTLFVERAQDAQPAFVLTAANAADVAAVCVGLDGLPLALELAAAWTTLLSARQLREALTQRLQLVTRGARDLPVRQRTLREAIAWSYALLNAGEAQLFARLAVFQGGLTLEAGVAVCNQDGVLALDPREGVQALLDKSLVQQGIGADGEPRFWMLETIREYAGEMLAAQGGATALRTAHLVYFTRLAEQVEPELWGPQQYEGLARLEAEHDNLRAALHWAGQAGAPGAALGLRLAGALGPFWHMRGYWSEGRIHLTAALAAPGLDTERAGRVRALLWAGLLATGQNAYADARSLLQQRLTLSRELGDPPGIAVALDGLVDVFLGQGDYPAAKTLAEQSLLLWREIGDQGGIAYALSNLGLVAYEEGQYDAARARHEEGLEIVRALGDKRSIAHTLNNLGNL